LDCIGSYSILNSIFRFNLRTPDPIPGDQLNTSFMSQSENVVNLLQKIKNAANTSNFPAGYEDS